MILLKVRNRDSDRLFLNLDLLEAYRILEKYHGPDHEGLMEIFIGGGSMILDKDSTKKVQEYLNCLTIQDEEE